MVMRLCNYNSNQCSNEDMMRADKKRHMTSFNRQQSAFGSPHSRFNYRALKLYADGAAEQSGRRKQRGVSGRHFTRKCDFHVITSHLKPICETTHDQNEGKLNAENGARGGYATESLWLKRSVATMSQCGPMRETSGVGEFSSSQARNINPSGSLRYPFGHYN